MWQFLNPNPYGYNMPYDSLSPFIVPSSNPYPYLSPVFGPQGQYPDTIQTGYPQPAPWPQPAPGPGQPSGNAERKHKLRTAVIVCSMLGGSIVLGSAAALAYKYYKPSQRIEPISAR